MRRNLSLYFETAVQVAAGMSAALAICWSANEYSKNPHNSSFSLGRSIADQCLKIDASNAKADVYRLALQKQFIKNTGGFIDKAAYKGKQVYSSSHQCLNAHFSS